VSAAEQQRLALREAGLPLDPHELADLTAPERGRAYEAAGLDALQRIAAEEAVRAMLAGRYPRRSR
jgi:hypothetical protein